MNGRSVSELHHLGDDAGRLRGGGHDHRRRGPGDGTAADEATGTVTATKAS